MKLLSACLLALVQLYTHFSQLLSVLRYWGERLRAFKDARSGKKNNFQCLSRAAAVVSVDSLTSSRVLCAEMHVQAILRCSWVLVLFPQ